MEKTQFKESEDTDYAEDQLYESHDQSDFTEEEDYLLRLKTQRKRIEELCLIQQSTHAELKKERETVKTLKEEIDSLRLRDTKVAPCQGTNTHQETTLLQEQNNALKEELLQVIGEKGQLINRLREEINRIRSTSSNQTENLEEQLSAHEEELELKTREWALREKELNDTIESLKETVTKNKQIHSDTLNSLQIKFDILEREQKKNTPLQSDSNNRENGGLREEVQRLSSIILNMEEQIVIQTEKHKNKVNTLKKQLKQRDKQNLETKDASKKWDKERKQLLSSLQEIKIEVKKTKQSSQSTLLKYQNEWASERAKLQQTIKKHLASIQDLLCIKDELANENNRLTRILRQKDQIEKQRKVMLKNECKEIDRLERVIDRIVD